MSRPPIDDSQNRTGSAGRTRVGRRPIIVMTSDIGEGEERAYAVKANYAEAIAAAGGVALILPCDAEQIHEVLELADGVLITGARPGAEVAAQRIEFERLLVRDALMARKPLLGICHGMQLIGEYLGGSVEKDLPEMNGDVTPHIPSDIPDSLAHDILLEPGSDLARWHCHNAAKVNSLHRHALGGLGRFRIAARAPDGVIEAFEGLTDSFCVGVQWHPEYRLTSLDRHLLKEFVSRCVGDAEVPSDTADLPGASVYARLSEMGLSLPEAPVPTGAFKGAIRTGNTVTVSGQVPLKDRRVLKTGLLGADVSIDEGRECARWALLNALAQLNLAASGLQRIKGFVRLAGYVSAAPTFTEHGRVVDGASELLRDLFPDNWAHARVALGVSSLPRGVPVEIELSAVIAEGF